MQKGKMVTSKDIARECGVSQTTVSYVINNTAGVNISEKTRKLVLETAKRLNYVPNSAARGMRMKNAGSVGVVVGRDVVNIGFNRVLSGVKQILDEKGISITLFQDHKSREENIREYISYYRAGRIDGIVFCFYDVGELEMQAMQSAEVPYVAAGENGVYSEYSEEQDIRHDTIIECVELCKTKGWKDIKFFSFSYGGKIPSRKYDVFRKNLGIEFPQAHLERVIIQSDNRTREEIQKELLPLLQADSADLAVSPNQRMGMFVQSSIMKNNLKLPQSPKHICLDTSHVLQTVYPSVTSLDIPLREIGEQAGKQLIMLIKGEKPMQVKFKASLKLGASTQ